MQNEWTDGLVILTALCPNICFLLSHDWFDHDQKQMWIRFIPFYPDIAAPYATKTPFQPLDTTFHNFQCDLINFYSPISNTG